MLRYWVVILLAIGLSSPALSAEPSANTRLMMALWARDQDAVLAALKAGASPNYVAPFSEFKPNFGPIGWAADPVRLISALGLAARLGDLVLMDDLIRAGADINLHARADDTNLPEGNHKADLPSGPTTSLDMTKYLIGHGYHPTVADISGALEVREKPDWKEWSSTILNAPGVQHRVAAIEAGIDPDYQKYNDEQAVERAWAHRRSDTEAYEDELDEARRAAQIDKYGDTLASFGMPAVGDLVCSKPGVYQAKYFAWVAGHSANRVELRIAGSYDHNAKEFRPQDMRWDDTKNWAPCHIR